MTSAAKTTTAERGSIPRDPTSLGPAIHPGEMLLEEFLKPLGLSQPTAAKELGVSLNRLNELILGKRGITADTALRLSARFGTTPRFWMHLQADWDLQEAKRDRLVAELRRQGDEVDIRVRAGEGGRQTLLVVNGKEMSILEAARHAEGPTNAGFAGAGGAVVGVRD